MKAECVSMSSIDRPGKVSSPSPREWCVRVAVSVVQVVPKDLLNAWVACETFQRGESHFWPDNRALAVRMGVGPITSVQRLLLRLERLGILERRYAAGNRRMLVLRRRTSEPITPGEWSRMELRAELLNELGQAPLAGGGGVPLAGGGPFLFEQDPGE